eukprot:m.52510 g.52510  ORF g.52510 m.52510 type:complete len:194 (-) comp10797_c0_seq3:2929-3510(-)
MADFKYKSTGEFKDHHRSYSSIQPSQNKILARKYDQARYDAHRARISSKKSTIDNKAPKPYMHLHLKLKKVQLEEERIATIERDNRKLLEKMSKIMRTQGQVDNSNPYSGKSLNYEQRRKELLRISLENEAILRRIQNRQPNISAASLDADYVKSTTYGANITRFPPIEQRARSSRASSRGSRQSTSAASNSQ